MEKFRENKLLTVIQSFVLILRNFGGRMTSGYNEKYTLTEKNRQINDL